MRKTVAIVALAAGLAGPASAATVIDFTADNSTGGSVGTIGYNVSATDASNGVRELSFTTHDTNDGCTGTGWNFVCNPVGGRFDVGFGVKGNNPNEIDATPTISPIEYVQVTFDSLVKVLGFAGMLAYNGSQPREGTEEVVLEYSDDWGATWKKKSVLAFNDDNDPDLGIGTNDTFDKVGLAWLKTEPLVANVVRFTAGGQSPFDDRTANVTAAGLIVAPVPVPASLPLLLAGIGALGWAARRKRKSA